MDRYRQTLELYRDRPSVEDNLWMVNPGWSYVEKSWVDADPQYWASEPDTKLAPKPAAGAAHAPKDVASIYLIDPGNAISADGLQLRFGDQSSLLVTE